ncbi:hypothetical protein ACFE04_018237 [Oxalis oulophora]
MLGQKENVLKVETGMELKLPGKVYGQFVYVISSTWIVSVHSMYAAWRPAGVIAGEDVGVLAGGATVGGDECGDETGEEDGRLVVGEGTVDGEIVGETVGVETLGVVEGGLDAGEMLGVADVGLGLVGEFAGEVDGETVVVGGGRFETEGGFVVGDCW